MEGGRAGKLRHRKMKRHSGHSGHPGDGFVVTRASETLEDESQGAAAWVGVGRELGCVGRLWARGVLGGDPA